MPASGPHDHGPHGHHHGHDHGHHHHHHHHGADEGPVSFTDPAQESLSQALRSGFNVLRVIMVVLLVAYFMSGWFQVNPGQQGLIVRFGRLLDNTKADSADPLHGTPVFGPGWHFKLPDPLDEKVLIEATPSTIYVDTFLFQRDPADAGRGLGGRSMAEMVPVRSSFTPGMDGYMISGDRNLSHGLFTVQYRIADAARFVRSVGETTAAAEPLLRRLTESAVVRSVAGRRVEDILKFGEDRDASIDIVAQDVQRRLSESLERLETGILVERVTAETIEPGAVRFAFRQVTESQQDREGRIQQARDARNEILNRATGRQAAAVIAAIDAYGAAQALGPSAEGGDAFRLAELRARIDDELRRAEGALAQELSRAQARATAAREGLMREFREFEDLLEAYRQNPQATARRLWVRLREGVLTSVENEVFFLPASQIIEILSNRDPQRLIDAERQRYQQRRAPRPAGG